MPVDVAHSLPRQERRAGEHLPGTGVADAELLPYPQPNRLAADGRVHQVVAVQGHHVEISFPFRPAVEGGRVAEGADVVLQPIAIRSGHVPHGRIGKPHGQVQVFAAPGLHAMARLAEILVAAAADGHAIAAADRHRAAVGGDLERRQALLGGHRFQAEVAAPRADKAREDFTRRRDVRRLGSRSGGRQDSSKEQGQEFQSEHGNLPRSHAPRGNALVGRSAATYSSRSVWGFRHAERGEYKLAVTTLRVVTGCAHRSSLIAHRSSLIAHRSSLIAHRSSLLQSTLRRSPRACPGPACSPS